MSFGAGAPGPGPSASPMDDYMRNYGARLQSLLAGESGSGAMGGGAPTSALADEPQIPSGGDLGPDLYRNTGFEPRMQAPAPPQAGAPPGGQPGGAPPGGPPAQPGGQPGAQPGAKGDGQHQGTGPEGAGFRDIWNSQDKATRQQYLDKLQDNLKAANQSIDSAYKTMMDQLGGRPDTSLSKSEKGMLLMEFGMRMMQHSSGRGGYGKDTGAAFGAAGVETLQSMRGLQTQKLARQQYYDKLQQGLAIAQGREKSNLAARSALETGRDVRAWGQQDTTLARTGMQQEGANARAAGRTDTQLSIASMREAGANSRATQRHGEIKSQFADDSGTVMNTFKDGHVEPAVGKDGNPLHAAPGSRISGGGGKGFASEANYRMYMDTYGKDESGQPLTGPDLDQVKKDALSYASNPHAFKLTDGQLRQMAEKSADNYIRSNSLSWAGSSEQEIADKHDKFAEDTYQRLKRNGTPGPMGGANVPNRPKSALAGGTPTAATPTSPPAGKQAAPTGAVDYLTKNPGQASSFLQKYGYVPPGFEKYLNPTPIKSALH